jgi:hypothetical protein
MSRQIADAPSRAGYLMREPVDNFGLGPNKPNGETAVAEDLVAW